MAQSRWLYLMLSRTDTGMGKVIRAFTHCRYNHVSLSLDPELRSWVSFARYVRGVALAGGFVVETPERYLAGNSAIPVRIFRIEIPEARYHTLTKLFALAEKQDRRLIYNSFGALTCSFGIAFPVQGAYTCLELACAALGRSFGTLQELERYLLPWEIYQGNLRDLVSDSGCRSDAYFTRRGLLGGAKDTAKHFARLLARTTHLRRCDDPVKAYLSIE